MKFKKDKEVEMKQDLEFYLNHLKILCNHESGAYDYFLKWNAQMIQRPAEKSTCITMISDEGAGKTTIFEVNKKMIGNKAYFDKLYAMIDDPNFIATYYNYLKHMDISDFNIRSIPYTEYQQDLQELSVSPLELFV